MEQLSPALVIYLVCVALALLLGVLLAKKHKDNVASRDYARILHTSGIRDCTGRLIKRTMERPTFQLTKEEQETFFSVMTSPAKGATLPAGSTKDKRVLYLGRQASDMTLDSQGAVFFVVRLTDEDGPILDLTPFSFKDERIEEIAKKYDLINESLIGFQGFQSY